MKSKLMLFVIMLFSMIALAKDLPSIAVYVSGDLGDNERRVLGTSMLTALAKGERYISAERSNAFIAEMESELAKLPDGISMGNDQISELGKQFGADYVCMVDLTPAFGEYHVSARIIDVQTATIVYKGEFHSPLKTMSDLTQAADSVVRNIFAEQTRPRARERSTPIVASEDRNVGGNWSGWTDYYITPRYIYPTTRGTPNWALGVECGRIWQSGFYWGYEVGGGVSSDGITFGHSLNMGRIIDLSDDLELALGGFVGIWGEFWEEERWNGYSEYTGFGMLGPSIKLRYHNIELSYKLLVGLLTSGDYVDERNVSSNFMNHLSLGYHFQFQKSENRRRNRRNKIDFYIAPRYIYPVTEWVPNWALGLEFGMVWQNGFYLGIDIGGGYGETSGDQPRGLLGRAPYEEETEFTLGIGLSLGRVIDLSDDWKLALGGFVGVWFDGYEKVELFFPPTVLDGWDWFDSWNRRTIERDGKLGIAGPSIKLRYRMLELSYRALIGARSSEDYNERREWRQDGSWWGEGYWSWNSLEDEYRADHRTRVGFIHQFSLGFHFQTSRNR
ncbi:MAG: hypothetical protein LBU70_00125 [Chitinispirillales bacterium]|jgi:hypothetical protein|nr:hypothetical protein [Chitinispirillales bacterium]